MADEVRSIMPIIFYADPRMTNQMSPTQPEGSTLSGAKIGTKDFRPKDPILAVTQNSTPLFSDGQGSDDPKASSATDGASQSPSGSQSSPPVGEGSDASAAKDSSTLEPQLPAGLVTQVMIGNVEQPA